MNVWATVPLLLYSHKLVPKIQEYVRQYNKLEMPLQRVTEVIQRAIDSCNADAVVLVNQPGITLDDLEDYQSFIVLRSYSFMSSTLGAIPRVTRPVNLDGLSSYALRKCGGKYIEANGLDEIDTYIDSHKRVIRINLPELPDEPEARREALELADLSLRKTLRKLPSPYHLVVYTSSTMGLLNVNDETRWATKTIFPDLSEDASRSVEFERNEHVMEVDRPFPSKRTKLLNLTAFQCSHLLDHEVIYENEMLILGILAVTFVFLLLQLLKLILIAYRWSFGRPYITTAHVKPHIKATKAE